MLLPSAIFQLMPKLTVLYICPTWVSAVKPDSARYATLELMGSTPTLVAWVANAPRVGLVFSSAVSIDDVTSVQKPPWGGLLLMSLSAWVVLLSSNSTDPSRLLIASARPDEA